MGVPRRYSTVPETVQTFSFTDVATGLGYQILYATRYEDSSGSSGILSEFPLFSQGIETGVTSDYPLAPFQYPRVIEGTAYISLGYGTTGAGSYKLIVSIKKNSTTIASVISPTIAAPAARAFLAPITIPRTQFARGDVLTLTITPDVISGTPNGVYGADPVNRDGAVLIPSTNNRTTTQLILYTPFDIDL